MDCISEEKKGLLRKPFGEVVKGKEAVSRTRELLKGRKLIVVGDYCVDLFISNSLPPDIAVVDFKNMRESIVKEKKEKFMSYFKRKIFFKNPRGCISKSAYWIGEVKDKLSKYLIVVEGEEDLVALPLMLNLKGYILVYGIRNEGSVIVNEDEEANKVYKKLLSKS